MKKTAIVTGASRGIGFAIATQLGQDGFNIVIIDMNEQSQYQENFDKLTAAGVAWLYLQGNIC
ncbi:MAG: SDR family NAD(P)-dependent oxidoreductase, partial [Ruthenibacterium sp.]